MMFVIFCLLALASASASASPFQRRSFGDFRPTRYTSLDLSQVTSNRARNSGYKEYLRVPDDDGETDLYRLVGVAPRTGVRGGAATRYSANIGDTVPIYAEADDVHEYKSLMKYVKSRKQPTTYSGQGSTQQRPYNVKAESAIAGQNFIVLFDD